MKFALKNLEFDGQLVTCVVRDDGGYETISLVNDLIELADKDEEAYALICHMVQKMLEYAPAPLSLKA